MVRKTVFQIYDKSFIDDKFSFKKYESNFIN